jgi:hypothetical protein
VRRTLNPDISEQPVCPRCLSRRTEVYCYIGLPTTLTFRLACQDCHYRWEQYSSTRQPAPVYRMIATA